MRPGAKQETYRGNAVDYASRQRGVIEAMDAKLVFWSGATLNFALICVLSSAGLRQIRRGDVARHRRSMLAAGSLVLAFLMSYVLKLRFLGREDLSLWSPAAINTLRFHELCVLTMLVAGGVALGRAWRMRNTRTVTRRPEDPSADEAVVLLHRRAGRTAWFGALFGLLSALFVLFGMYMRA